MIPRALQYYRASLLGGALLVLAGVAMAALAFASSPAVQEELAADLLRLLAGVAGILVALIEPLVYLHRRAERSVTSGVFAVAGRCVVLSVAAAAGRLDWLGLPGWLWFAAGFVPPVVVLVERRELDRLGLDPWYGFRARWVGTLARRTTLSACLGVLVLGVVGTQYYRVDARFEAFRSGALDSPEVFYLPPHTALRFTSLGHESFLADALWVRFYAYFLRHLYADRIFGWFDAYVDAIRTLAPDNPRIYQWASQRVKYAQKITNEVIERSNHYARLGISRFPNDWRFYNDIGFNLFFEYRYADEEEKRRLQDEARGYFTMAASLPNSQLDPNFVTELYLRNNDTRMALFQAARRYHEASPTERRYLQRRIEQIDPNVARALSVEEERWRERYPYLPFGVFELMGGAYGHAAGGE